MDSYRYVPTEPIEAWLQRFDIALETHSYSTRPTLLEKTVSQLELLASQGQEFDIQLLLHLLERSGTLPEIREGVVRVCHLLQDKVPAAPILGLLYDGIASETCIEVLRDLYELITPEFICVEALHRRDDEITAIQVLENMQAEAPIGLLLSILQDENKDEVVRVYALYILHNLGASVPLEYYVLALDWTSHDVDYNMVEAMTRLGAQAPLSELVQLLGYNNNWVRTSAKRSLRNVAEYVPVELLLPALESENRATREEAASVFAVFGTRAPVDKLLAMVRDEHEYLPAREAALTTLISLGYPTPINLLLSLLEIDYYNLRIAVFSTFAAMGKEAPLEVLLELLHDKRFKADTINVLGFMAENAPVDLLFALFDNKDTPYICRRRAIFALARLGKNAPLEKMHARFYKADGEMRRELIEAFGAMKEHAPIDILLQALDSNKSDICDAAHIALLQLSEEVPAKLVAEARHDMRPVVRKMVLQTLVKLGKDAPVEIALAALEEREMLPDAFFALAQLRFDISSQMPLKAFLQKIDKNNEELTLFSWTGMTLLAYYGSQVPVELLLSQFGKNTVAASTLYQTHPEVFREVVAPQAEAILRGEAPAGVFAARVQSRIAEVIGQIGRVTPAVLDMVVALLDYPDRETRLKAIRSLGAIHRNIPDRAMRRLMELRHDQTASEVRQAADAALAEILSYELGMEDE